MHFSSSELKKNEVISWIKMFKPSSTEVMVSNYCYKCFFSGRQVTKTLIVFPDEIESKGIISINKPIDQVEMPDIIKLYKEFS